MEFYNQTHILDMRVLSKSPLKCKNLICQHAYIIPSITVEVVAGCGDTGAADARLAEMRRRGLIRPHTGWNCLGQLSNQIINSDTRYSISSLGLA